MKKIITLLTTILIFSFILTLPCFADDKSVTFSEDLQHLYFDGDSYSRVDTSFIEYTYGEDGYYSYYDSYDAESEKEYHDKFVNDLNIKLSDKQKQEITNLSVESTADYSLMLTEIYFIDGVTMSVNFMRDDLKADYDSFRHGDVKEYRINFMWPEGNSILVEKDKFYSDNKVAINFAEADTYDVIVDSGRDDYYIKVGVLISQKDKYYFFNFLENGVLSPEDIDIYYIENKFAYEITNPELIEEIKACEEKYFEDDFGYLYDDELTESVSKIFYILIFALIPAIIFTISLVFALKAKKPLYKKLLFAICAISIIVILIFIYIAFTLFNK